MRDIAAGPTHEWMHDWYRRKIEHEDMLIVERVSWLLTSEAFLFVAYIILFTVPRERLFLSPHLKELFLFIPIVALVCDVVASMSIGAAISAYYTATKDFEVYDDAFRTAHPEWGCRENLTPNRTTRKLGKTAAVSVPLILFGAWGWLLAMSPAFSRS
jgi:hypothetical protein